MCSCGGFLRGVHRVGEDDSARRRTRFRVCGQIHFAVVANALRIYRFRHLTLGWLSADLCCRRVSGVGERAPEIAAGERPGRFAADSVIARVGRFGERFGGDEYVFRSIKKICSLILLDIDSKKWNVCYLLLRLPL